MDVLRSASIFAKLTLLVDLVPFVMAIIYLARPTERNLALMRPLSLAGLFAALAGGVLGVINTLHFGWTHEFTDKTYHVMAIAAAESLVPVLVGFASLTVAWLLVAVGMGRRVAGVAM
ncbi:MAG TPA: hypothetical protein VGH34_23885 [Vicinamibacterales bacterium]|jgi:hypothetical protein